MGFVLWLFDYIMAGVVILSAIAVCCFVYFVLFPLALGIILDALGLLCRFVNKLRR
jgi:hypothetical protein